MADLTMAYKVLTKDPVLRKVIQSTGRLEALRPYRNVYFSMLQSIASQQLSVKAGDTIFGRFLDLFPDKIPHPEKVIKMNIEKMRKAGLSYAKAGYIKNIAEFSISNGLEYRKLNRMDDDELMNYLITIKGVGRWTSEMILMFTLSRPDILPIDDVGIRNEMRALYKIEGEGKFFIEKMTDIAEAWRPYRTLACRHLWRFRDT